MWQIILAVILVVPLTAGNILVRPLDGRKKPRNVRILNQAGAGAGATSKTAEGQEIQGFTIVEDGASKILYIDLSLLRAKGIFNGGYDTLSFGEDTKVTPFNDVKVEQFDADEIERKLNEVLHPDNFIVPPSPVAKNVQKSSSSLESKTSKINSKNPVRITLQSAPVPNLAPRLIAPAQHIPLPSAAAASLPASSSDNSLETLAALKIARRKALNI